VTQRLLTVTMVEYGKLLESWGQSMHTPIQDLRMDIITYGRRGVLPELLADSGDVTDGKSHTSDRGVSVRVWMEQWRRRNTCGSDPGPWFLRVLESLTRHGRIL
jgi:hypothetical protein